MELIRRIFVAIGRRILFWIGRDDPEKAHEVAVRVLGLASRSEVGVKAIRLFGRSARTYDPHCSRHFMGLEFFGPVGLAAGFDKNGRCLAALSEMGFGFLEAGGVTAGPQAGNAHPRVFRYNAEKAMVNSLGFPGEGASAVAGRQQGSPRPRVPVGWNLAKSRNTPVEKAADDYIEVMERLWKYSDYFSINISSPNTPGLRQLEDPDLLARTLRQVVAARDDRAERDGRRPLLVKVSPDMHLADIHAVVDVCIDEGLEGIIAVNTSVSRAGLPNGTPRAGGMSGRPLHERAVRTVARVADRADSALTVIGVGGILSAADAVRMMSAGASLVEVCTGFIFRGPTLVEEINSRVRSMWLAS